MDRIRIGLAFVALLAGLAKPVVAQDARFLGSARLFTNDYLGDGQDRWRTGSSHVSLLWSPENRIGRPDRAGLLLDYRLTSQIITPSAALERPYVGMVGIGVHTLWRDGPVEWSLGGDVTITGPQTRLSEFQLNLHEALDIPPPRGVEDQFGNAALFGAMGEVAWTTEVSDGIVLRPFLEAQLGPEDMMRGGFDLLIGSAQSNALRIREPVTGHLLRPVRDDMRGALVVIGADWARVWDSVYLPGDEGVNHEEWRVRTRAGVLVQSTRNMSFFFGLTRLSPEVQAQSSGQTVGSMTLNIAF